jgi:TolB-like protein
MHNSNSPELHKICSGFLFEDLDGASPAFDQWLLVERARMTNRLEALHAQELARLAGPGIGAEERIAVARRITTIDPTHEAASRLLMTALAESGDHAQAIREFARLQDAMQRSLELDASPETQRLIEAIRLQARRPRGGPAAAPRANPPPAVARQPSRTRFRIGVMPFAALDGGIAATLPMALAQETAAALARFRWFDVIAPIGLGGLPDGESDWPRRFRDLDTDYVVRGILSSAGELLTVSVTLLNLADEPRAIWSDSITRRARRKTSRTGPA